MTDAEWHLDFLRGSISDLLVRVQRLERAERARIIDDDQDDPPPARETDGNLICLPGVTLATVRRSRQRRRKAEKMDLGRDRS